MHAKPRPDCLIDSDGNVSTGLFDRSVRTINGRDFDYRTPMGRRQSALPRHFHYKQFQYFGILSGEVLAGCALAHTGYLGLAFVYAYDTRSGRMHEETFRRPLGMGLSMGQSPVSGESSLTLPEATIRLAYQDDGDGTLAKTVSVRTAKGLHIEADFTEPRSFQPLSLCTRTGYNGWTYTNKVAGLPVRGQVHSPLGSHDLVRVGACGNHDFSAGYMRRETFWNWACLSGQAGGHHVGLNLSCGVNETSFSENCLWIDGQRYQTGLATFNFDRRAPFAPWHITTGASCDDARAELLVTPTGLHAEQLNLGLFASNFRQFFGRYSGTLSVPGRTIEIDGLWGFVEDQYAKW